jgi:hypothetical protein
MDQASLPRTPANINYSLMTIAWNCELFPADAAV